MNDGNLWAGWHFPGGNEVPKQGLKQLGQQNQGKQRKRQLLLADG